MFKKIVNGDMEIIESLLSPSEVIIFLKSILKANNEILKMNSRITSLLCDIKNVETDNVDFNA